VGAELVNFETGGTDTRNINGRSYHIAKSAIDSDVVISLAKFKTHGLTLFTGGLKNTFGVIPGFGKGEMHKRFPNPSAFSDRLVDVFSLVKPAITVMDGVIGMEGNGPSSGSPREFGFIAASEDAVSLDSVCSWIMGFDPSEIATTTIAARRGIGEDDLSAIEIKGIPRERFRQPDVKLPSNRGIRLIPPFIARALGKFIWTRPRANPDLCDSCGLCVKSCPVSCIELAAGIPDIEYSDCINCLCCNEICPQGAMEIEMSRLAKRIG
jgi:ferredoxin